MKNEVLTIENEKYKALITANYGMNCFKIESKQTGKNILRSPKNTEFLGDKDAFLFGMPILCFPNRISGGEFVFENIKYKFPITEKNLNNFCHGEMHRLPFEIVEQGENLVRGRFEATKDMPYMMFHHEFRLDIEYMLDGSNIKQNVYVTNLSDKNMPFALGFHTAFSMKFDSDKNAKEIRLCIFASSEAERNMETFLPTGNFIHDFDGKDEMRNGSYAPYGNSVSKLLKLNGNILSLSGDNSEIRYIYDSKFKFCMLFNGNGEEFICLEPQTCLTDCLNVSDDPIQDGLIVIKPNETVEFQNIITVLKK